MCKILLSINPEHVKHILDGSKEYEFRKTRCKREVDAIVIYSTAPEMRVVAEADVDSVIEDKPETVWRIAGDKSGISRSFFFQYFNGRNKAIAYKLSNLRIFEEPQTLSDYGLSVAPQSFVYV